MICGQVAWVPDNHGDATQPWRSRPPIPMTELVGTMVAGNVSYTVAHVLPPGLRDLRITDDLHDPYDESWVLSRVLSSDFQDTIGVAMAVVIPACVAVRTAPGP